VLIVMNCNKTHSKQQDKIWRFYQHQSACGNIILIELMQ